MDVLSGGDSRSLTARKIIEVLEDKGKFVHVNKILEVLSDPYLMKSSFIRSCLKMYVAKGILAEKGNKLNERYKIVNTNKKDIDDIIEEKFGGSDLPSATKQHFLKYGFEELVGSVARQINHEGVLIKEYNIDRLWLSRYIDFLEKAKEYTSFRLSDNQVASKKASEFKKQSKINKKNEGKGWKTKR